MRNRQRIYMMFRFRRVSVVVVWMVCAMLPGGCTVGPDYERPDLEMPTGWSDEAIGGDQSSPEVLRQWWTLLGDPILDDLVEQAAGANLDAKASLMRIAESRASRDLTAGLRSPQIDAVGSYSRMRSSEETRFSYSGIPTDPYDLYSVGFDATWEIDLFGQIRRSIESSQASLEASIEDHYDVLRTLFAEVARNYVELRTTQVRIKYALQNIDSQLETVALTERRFEAGLSGELDVAQAKLNLANTESEVPALRLAEIQTINRIAVLLGRYPQELRGRFDQGSIPSPFDPGSPPVPVDLLRRRPDIRRAERELAAQTARIGVATADLYPSFTLDGVFNLEAEDFGNLGNWASRAYSFGPGFRWYVLGGDQVSSNIQRETAATEQASLRYEQTVLSAVEEVSNAMASLSQDKERLAALQRSADQSERSVKLVGEQYANGLTDFQNVLDMQRTLWTQQDRLAGSRGQVVLDLIRIYKAIGGGWPMGDGGADDPTAEVVESDEK